MLQMSMLQAYQLKSTTFTSGRPVIATARSSTSRHSRCLSASIRAENVLIANTKGGGHAFIGLHLAKQLLSAGHSVTILNDGDPVSHPEMICAAHFYHADSMLPDVVPYCGPGQDEKESSIQPV